MSALCVHSTAGRLRLRSSAMKNNASRAATIQTCLERCAGVRRVETNLLTGSVLVNFDSGSATAESIIREMRKIEVAPSEGYPELQPMLRPLGASRQTKRGITEAVARRVARSVVEQLAERLVIVLILAVAA